MAQRTQIIPPYAYHPHTTVVINDNTVTTLDTPSSTLPAQCICVYTGGNDRDNQLIFRNNLSDWLDEHGTPNFGVNGQPELMPYAILANDGACYTMRVSAADAATSNVVLALNAKFDTDKIITYFTAHALPNIDNADKIAATIDTLEIDDAGSATNDGYLRFPLACFYATGTGTGGNDLRARLTVDSSSNKVYTGFPNYIFEVKSSKTGNLTKESYLSVAFSPDAVQDYVSHYIMDKVNDSDMSSSLMNVFVNTDGYDKLLSFYNTNITVDGNLDLVKSDIFFGMGNMTEADTFIDGKIKGMYLNNTLLAEDVEGLVNLSSIDGVALSAGSNGNFDDPTNGEQNKTDRLIEAFNGKISAAISSKRRYHVPFMYDANFPNTVKAALSALVAKRGDCQVYLDGGLKTTWEEVKNWATSSPISTITDRTCSKDFQYYAIMDPFTGKKINVTMTYAIASMMAKHVRDNGIGIPLTGDNYARLSGQVKNSLKPNIDADDCDLKEELGQMQLNYWEATAENRFSRGTQTTSQTITSDLSEENNVRILLVLKKKLEDMASSNFYQFTSEDDRKKFTEAADRAIDDYRQFIASATVQFSASQLEIQRSLLHCYLAIQFRTMNKGVIIEIDINKRTE